MFELSRRESIRRAGMSKVIAVLLASVCAASSPFAQKYKADVPHSTDRHTEDGGARSGDRAEGLPTTSILAVEPRRSSPACEIRALESPKN